MYFLVVLRRRPKKTVVVRCICFSLQIGKLSKVFEGFNGQSYQENFQGSKLPQATSQTATSFVPRSRPSPRWEEIHSPESRNVNHSTRRIWRRLHSKPAGEIGEIGTVKHGSWRDSLEWLISIPGSYQNSCSPKVESLFRWNSASYCFHLQTPVQTNVHASEAFFRHSLASIFQNVSAHVHLMYYPSKSAAAQQTKIVWAIFQSMVQLHTDISCIFKKLDMKSTIESAGMKRKV